MSSNWFMIDAKHDARRNHKDHKKKQLSCSTEDILIFQDIASRYYYLLSLAQNNPNDDELVDKWKDFILNNFVSDIKWKLVIDTHQIETFNSMDELIDEETGIIGLTKNHLNLYLYGSSGFADCESNTAQYTERGGNYGRESDSENSVGLFVGNWSFQKINDEWKVVSVFWDEKIFGIFDSTNLHHQFQGHE